MCPDIKYKSRCWRVSLIAVLFSSAGFQLRGPELNLLVLFSVPLWSWTTRHSASPLTKASGSTSLPHHTFVRMCSDIQHYIRPHGRTASLWGWDTGRAVDLSVTEHHQAAAPMLHSPRYLLNWKYKYPTSSCRSDVLIGLGAYKGFSQQIFKTRTQNSVTH